jgi:hypothetical protein
MQRVKSLLLLRSLVIVTAISTLPYIPVASAAQDGRRCSFLVDGLHRDAGDCLYTETDDCYEVAFHSRKYTLITKTVSGQPKLFIDGTFTAVGSGNYSSSITGACGLFIALSEAKEELNRSLDNYDRGLCVSQ